jgi:diacylglycerol O-acyltransferase / wax synthase
MERLSTLDASFLYMETPETPMPSDISILGAPFVMTGLAEWMGRTKAADQMPAMVNVLISNVPGPRKPMYCAGAELEHYFPVSIPSHGGALNITVQSTWIISTSA